MDKNHNQKFQTIEIYKDFSGVDLKIRYIHKTVFYFMSSENPENSPVTFYFIKKKRFYAQKEIFSAIIPISI